MHESRAENLLDNASWAGLQIIKLAMRWLPERVEELRDIFSIYHGDALDNQTHHYYWDLQIAEAFLNRTLKPDFYARASAKRLVRVSLFNGTDWDTAAYKHSTACEGEYLLAQMPRISLVDFGT